MLAKATEGRLDLGRETLPWNAGVGLLGRVRGGEYIIATSDDCEQVLLRPDDPRWRSKVCDEKAYFGTDRAATDPSLAIYDPEEKVLLTRSQRSDAPNMLYWAMLWDVESGIPLSDRKTCFNEDDFYSGKVGNEWSLSDGHASLEKGIVYRPSLESLPVLADYAEQLSGLKLDEHGLTGRIEPTPESASALRGKLTEQWKRLPAGRGDN